MPRARFAQPALNWIGGAPPFVVTLFQSQQGKAPLGLDRFAMLASEPRARFAVRAALRLWAGSVREIVAVASPLKPSERGVPFGTSLFSIPRIENQRRFRVHPLHSSDRIGGFVTGTGRCIVLGVASRCDGLDLRAGDVPRQSDLAALGQTRTAQN